MTAAPDPVVAYLVSRYPYVSHTFVQREVAELRRNHVDVRTFSVHRIRRQDVLSAADRDSAATTVSLRDGGLLRVAAVQLAALAAHPVAYLATASAAVRLGRGARGRLWQLFYLAEAVVLWRHCRRAGVHHVHAHFANNGSDIARLAAAFGRAQGEDWSWSFTMHGPTEFADVTRFGLARKARDADFVVCISDFCRSQLMALTPYEHWSKYAVVHCGIPPDDSGDPPGAAEPHDALRVLTVARLDPVKGHPVLLDAVADLTTAGHGVELALVGDGPCRAELEALATDRRLGSAVRFVGAVGQDDIAAWYAWADVFCLPSFMEGVPVVLMEAMSHGLPVVTTRINGIPELVHHGDSGFVVTPGRADLLAEALGALRDPRLRARMGSVGRRDVTLGFDATRSGGELAALLRSRLGGGVRS